MEVADFADRAESFVVLDRRWRYGRWWQEFPAELNHGLAITVRKKAEMPDLYKAAGQNVQEEAADELHGVQGHLFDLIVILRISPSKAHATILKAQQPPIGNRHSMGISRQIPQDLLRSTERMSGVNYPRPRARRSGHGEGSRAVGSRCAGRPGSPAWLPVVSDRPLIRAETRRPRETEFRR